MNFDFGSFGPMGTFVSGLMAIATIIQLGLVVLLVIVLIDLRGFLREGCSLMRRTDRFLARQEHSD